MVLIVTNPIPGIELAPFVKSMWFEGAYLSTPKGLSCEQTIR